MSTSVEKPSTAKSPFNVQTLILMGITWAVVSLLFFLLFSATPNGAERPQWYAVGTLILELGAFLWAAILCFRNWQSRQIVSGRNVWLCFGLGMTTYFIGSVLFGIWELVWAQDPTVSIGDFFYFITYICLGIGMILAVASRRLNLEVKQWLIVGTIGIIGIALAVWLSIEPPSHSTPAAKPAAVERVAPAAKPAKAIAPEAPEAVEVPTWVSQLETQLEPLGGAVLVSYAVFDIALLITASMLLLAFWGGRFSQSWRMIAAAAFSLYIADMWFKYASSRIPNYESGGLLEVFWVFCGVLFGMGAALEYDISTRSTSRRTTRRRS